MGRFRIRFGSRILSSIGLGFVSFGLFQLSTLDASATPLDVVLRHALVGIGMGLFGPPNNSALMGSAPHDLLGLAGGLMASVRNMGNTMGVAIAGTVLSLQTVAATALLTTQGVPAAEVESQAFLVGFQAALRFAALFAAIGVVTALVRGSAQPQAQAHGAKETT